MRIVTHSGKIHSDEVAAISLLSNYFAHKNIIVTVLRSRNTDSFLDTDILVDVGLEYDHDFLRYDHHQKGFNERWDYNSEIPLSSAGLIWRHYGSEIIEMYLSKNENTDTINDLKNIIYYKLIQEIDANDNGIPFENSYISNLVAALNGDVNDEKVQNENFNRAIELVGNIFDIKFNEIITSYFNYQKDLQVVKDLDLSGSYLIINQNIPTIFKCLDELDPKQNIKFCIFENDNEYTIKTRKQNEEKFIPLCPILSEEILRKTCNDIIFVHKAGFLAKTKTLESATIIVKLSLNEIKDEKKKRLNLEVLKDKRVIGGIAVTSLAALGFLYWNQDN